jgi:phage gpG-like protein
MPTYKVESFGMELVAHKWRRSTTDAINMKPAFDKVANYFMGSIDRSFSSQGRRGGGSWRRVTPKWAKYKARVKGDPRILHFGVTHKSQKTEHLRRSLTKRRASKQVLIINPHGMILESRVSYARKHQFGRGNTPARPFVKVLPGDRQAAVQIIEDHLTRQWQKKGGGTGVRGQR